MGKFLFIFVTIVTALSTAVKAQSTPDTTECKVQGTINSKLGDVVKINVNSTVLLPAIGVRGVLSKHFETDLFGGNVSGWLAIGEMKVNAVDKDIVTFALQKELSVVTENGAKKDHFVVGREVKFVWKVPVPADEIAYQKGQNIVEEDLEGALKYYRETLLLNPKHDRALNMVGMVMNELKEPDSALWYFRKAFTVNNKNIQYAKNISITSHIVGKTTDACEFAEKALLIDSTDAEAHYLRGLMLYLINKDALTDKLKKTIVTDFDKAVLYDPTESFFWSERAFLRNEFGDKSGACEDARKAKELGAADGDDLIKAYCN